MVVSDMPRGRPIPPLILTTTEQATLQSVVRRSTAGQAEALRARVILLCGEGLPNEVVAERTGICPHSVGKWRRRFLADRLSGLEDLPRPGAPRRISDEQIAEVIRLTLETRPKNATHWSTRKMARRCGLSNERVARIWQAFGLQPHRVESFQLSTDPLFVEKVRDVVGLYMSPPQNALVLCVDEKSQIQALERSQPLLPLRPGVAERHTHDYFRHGTTSLFAALDVSTGAVYGECQARHTHREFLHFLRKLEGEIPPELQVHLVIDNYAAHKTPTVRNWFARHPRWHVHFIPTHSSWLNQVERFFAQITTKRIRRGSFRSVAELRQAILSYIDRHNAAPRPFQWTASADLILGKVQSICSGLT
jgi:transposase